MPKIYALTDPRDHKIRIIGKAVNPSRRLIGHWNSRFATDSQKNLWLRELDKLGVKPEICVLEVVRDGDWRSAERHWIAHHANTVFNHLPGGEGPEQLEAFLDDEWCPSRPFTRADCSVVIEMRRHGLSAGHIARRLRCEVADVLPWMYCAMRDLTFAVAPTQSVMSREQEGSDN
jgi:hypothetical protein